MEITATPTRHAPLGSRTRTLPLEGGCAIQLRQRRSLFVGRRGIGRRTTRLKVGDSATELTGPRYMSGPCFLVITFSSRRAARARTRAFPAYKAGAFTSLATAPQ